VESLVNGNEYIKVAITTYFRKTGYTIRVHLTVSPYHNKGKSYYNGIGMMWRNLSNKHSHQKS